MGKPSAVPAPAPRTGDIFRVGEVLSDTFEVKGVLGSGGMGQVFDAHDRLLNRRVAIKAAWPDQDAAALHKEAQALAAIRHPSVALVHGIQRHGTHEYVVMERILGKCLEQHIDEKRASGQLFALDEALTILIGIADGLAVVHAAGIAHRDIKPANVMLAPGNRFVLMDFGIFLSERDAVQPNVTGSPQYMAPETITGQVARGAVYLVDTYAFGVLAYELLTGDVPYADSSVPKLLQQHMIAPVPSVAARRPNVPTRLTSLVMELMAKDPRERPASMDEVAGELRKILKPPERTSLGPMRIA